MKFSILSYRGRHFLGIVERTCADRLSTRFRSLRLELLEYRTLLSVDFGDAPAPYPTLLTDDGARHEIAGPRLGSLVDAEADGLPTILADGDDTDGSADEDGVTVPVLTVSSIALTTANLEIDLQNADPTANYLDAWIDFNGDGDWADPGEQIFTSYSLGTGSAVKLIPFVVPQDTGDNIAYGTTCARFRLSTAGGLSPTGAAADGEVEDHTVDLTWFGPPQALNTNATTDSRYDGSPHITTDGAGNWVAVWNSSENLNGTIGTDYDIFVSRSTDAGTTWTDPVPLNTNAGSDSGHDFQPQVTTDGAGNWLAVWNSDENLGGTIGTDDDILMARSIDAGTTWTDPAPLNNNAETDSLEDWEPKVTTDGSGNWLAVWTFGTPWSPGTPPDILVSRSIDVGVTWTDPVTLNSNAGSGSAWDSHPQVATDGAGNWLAVWRSNDDLGGTIGTDADILMSHSTDAGASWSPATPLNSNAGSDSSSNDYAPQVTTDGSGNWLAVWSSTNDLGGTIGTDYDIFVSRSTDAGANWTPPASLRSNAGSDSLFDEDLDPQVTTDGVGKWFAVWRTDDNLTFNSHFFVSRSADAGATWTDPAPLSCRASLLVDSAPQITTDKAGNWGAAWSSHDDLGGTIGADPDILFATFSEILWDYGDAPAPYPTLLADHGARHYAAGPRLGSSLDAEADGLPTALADGDDNDGSADEDGATFGSPIMVGQLGASVTVNVQDAASGAKLDAWIDFNGDGCWGGPFEQIASSVAVGAGDNSIFFDVPSWAVAGQTYARFRLSTAGGLSPMGPASDGEVEDHRLQIVSSAISPGPMVGRNVVSDTADGAASVFAVDVNGDGDMDVLSASIGDDTIAWYENDGFGNFTAHTITDFADYALAVFAADVDGDGDMDVLSASRADHTIAWYENDGDEFFTARAITTSANNPQSVFAADVDGDGDMDVLSATTGDDTIAWYENDGAENFAHHAISTSANGAVSVFATDVDGDGDMDALSASTNDDKIAWYENDGSQGFTEHAISTSADYAWTVFATDVDGDGDMDVLSASEIDDKIAWYENDGDENFAEHAITTSADGAVSVFATDLDGDGDMDVLSASYEDDTIAWYENDGDENFAPHTVTASADYAWSVFAADVNGDGDLDVLSASVWDNTVAWYEEAGVTIKSFSEPTTTEGGSSTMFYFVLDSQPTADVTITFSSTDTSEGTVLPTSLNFTAANWNTPQPIGVWGMDDLAADGDVAYTIITDAAISSDPNYDGLDVADISLVNLDDDTAGIDVSPTSGLQTTEDGGTDTFEIVLTSQPTADVIIDLTSSNTAEGTVSPSSVVFSDSNWYTPRLVTLTGQDDLVVDGDVPYTIVTSTAISSDPNYSGLDPADISAVNLDDDVPGIFVTPTSGLQTTETGAMDTFEIVLASQPTADVTIGLTSSDTAEGSVNPANVVFSSTSWNTPQVVTVTGQDDFVDDGDVAYTVVTAAATSSDPNFSGLDAADISVVNVDDDTAGVDVSPTSGLETTEAGGTDTFQIVLTSQPTADVTIGLTSSNTAEGTVSPSNVLFSPTDWNTPREVTVTGQDDFVGDGDVVYTIITGPAVSTDAGYSDLNADDVAVTNEDDENILPVNLGRVDFRLLESIDPVVEDLWFSLETSHAGWLTVLADGQWTPQQMTLRLFSPADLAAALVTSNAADATPRIDHDVSGGELYMLQVTGSAADANLLLANLVHKAAGIVTVYGTEEADVFAFDAAASREITINGVPYHYDDNQVSTVNFNGGDGRDVAWLFDSPGDEDLEAWPDRATLVNGAGDSQQDYVVNVSGIQDLLSYATRGGNDSALLHGSDQADKLKSYEDSVRLRAKDSSYTLRAKKFDAVTGDSGESGKDLAVFNGSDGDETFTYTGADNSARVEGLQRDHTASDFDAVVVRAGRGEDDVAHFTDIPNANDVFYFKSHKTTLVSPDVEVTVRAFDRVHATASESGYDVARVYDTAGDEHLDIHDDTVCLYRRNGNDMELMYEAIAFETLKAYSTEGDDTKDVGDTSMTLLLYGWDD